MIIAIDGPSGAGKSTVAKLLSNKLNFEYIDTGAMYRALAYKAYINKIDIHEENSDKISKMLNSTTVDYYDNNIYLDGQNVEGLIRDELISINASKISTLAIVRNKMVDLQRKIAENKNVILDGRDIGTVVFPNADYKFFVTASEEVRAVRRYNQLVVSNKDIILENILADIKKRDEKDSSRKISPLRIADDAILIDTSDMSLEETVNKLVDIIGGPNVL
ncbi:(d)CMP kinase [Sedimentibacter hydroxybenzoicus DSM 7310]|uniref:Cytidylate kinase n=1 Tax=Sedimentibacter hydroxybenzoicus DSM 7310 TaxID=1123245 RepID=A0A974BIJ8_SEDHY|nr:(d)CMP kinase [Sedimentibacter hydroxybenzoicus]NYB73546.1 (d)CMP kinase [Sedimentibacter hydroxybenzoicus DSM 7310]